MESNTQVKQLVWLASAQKDLQSLYDHYAPKAGAAKVAEMIQHIVQQASLLTTQPYLGVVSNSDDDVLEWHVARYPYTLPYLIQDDCIVMLRVFHQSQQRPSQWETR